MTLEECEAGGWAVVTVDEFVALVVAALGDDEQAWEEFMTLAWEMVRQEAEAKS